MVSAVFHSPLEASRQLALEKNSPDPVRAEPVEATATLPSTSSGQSGVQAQGERAHSDHPELVEGQAQGERVVARTSPRIPFDTRAIWMAVLPPVLGIALLIGLWALLTKPGGAFPAPGETFAAAVKLFASPFYDKGPNDQGIGWNILFSLERVAIGFGLAALVGIPLGFLIGRFTFLNRMVNPLISLLRPVSPLAWLPIGLLVFKAANPAAIWTIFICSIWPMVINTAVGVQRVPQDYLNVARVLKLSEWKVMTRILFPAVLPYMLTGVRLSVGTAWLVIVAAEMLTGGVGIGFWVWDEWNNLNVKHILIAIFIIGIVGLLLELLLVGIAKRFSYD